MLQYSGTMAPFYQMYALATQVFLNASENAPWQQIYRTKRNASPYIRRTHQ